MKKIGVFELIFIEILVSIFTFILFGIIGAITNYNITRLGERIFIDSTLIIILLIYGKANKNSICERFNDFKNKFNIKEILLLYITLAVFSFGSSTVITAIIYKFNPQKAIKIMNENHYDVNNGLELIGVTIAIAILAPILEELVFRRIIFKSFSRNIGIIFGAILSSIIFGALHLDSAKAGAMIFGFIACILYEKYKNILIPMSIHMLNNTSVSIFDIAGFFNGTLNKGIVSNINPSKDLIIGSILLIIATIILGKYIYNNRKIFKKKNKTISNEQVNI